MGSDDRSDSHRSDSLAHDRQTLHDEGGDSERLDCIVDRSRWLQNHHRREEDDRRDYEPGDARNKQLFPSKHEAHQDTRVAMSSIGAEWL